MVLKNYSELFSHLKYFHTCIFALYSLVHTYYGGPKVAAKTKSRKLDIFTFVPLNLHHLSHVYMYTDIMTIFFS